MKVFLKTWPPQLLEFLGVNLLVLFGVVSIWVLVLLWIVATICLIESLFFLFTELKASPKLAAVVDLYFELDKHVEHVFFPELSHLSASKAVAYSVTKYVPHGVWMGPFFPLNHTVTNAV